MPGRGAEHFCRVINLSYGREKANPYPPIHRGKGRIVGCQFTLKRAPMRFSKTYHALVIFCLSITTIPFNQAEAQGYIISQTCVSPTQVDMLVQPPYSPGGPSSLYDDPWNRRAIFYNHNPTVVRVPAGAYFPQAVWSWQTQYDHHQTHYSIFSYSVRNDCTPPAPYCSISLSPNPINRGSASTLSWSSSGSVSSFYIANVGYVSSSGSTSVSPANSTSYAGTVYGPGGSRSCSGTQTLTVYQSCSWNGGTITHGSSVTAYQAPSLPYGSSCTSQTRTCSNGTLSGSYQYASCTVESLPPPPSSVSISADPSVLSRNGTTNLTWSSSNATACTVTGGGETWSGTASPGGGQETGPIIGEVTFVVSCQNDGGTTSASTTVRVLPTFEET